MAGGGTHAQGIRREGHVGAEKAQEQLALALLPLCQRVPQRQAVAHPAGQRLTVGGAGQRHRGQRPGAAQLHLLRQAAGGGMEGRSSERRPLRFGPQVDPAGSRAHLEGRWLPSFLLARITRYWQRLPVCSFIHRMSSGTSGSHSSKLRGMGGMASGSAAQPRPACPFFPASAPASGNLDMASLQPPPTSGLYSRAPTTHGGPQSSVLSALSPKPPSPLTGW